MNTFILQAAVSSGMALILGRTFIPVLQSLAPAMGLIDRPNARKLHHKAIPLIGGISVVFASALAILPNEAARLLIAEMALPFTALLAIFIMAVLDDRKNLPARVRLLIQLATAFTVAASGLRIESLHGVFGVSEIPVGLQYVLTMVVITGVTNAFNLIDGIDGLAGGLALVNMLVFSLVAYLLQLFGLSILCLALAGALVAFLRSNTHPAVVFMGDGGSMTLGFLMAIVGIKLIQPLDMSGEFSELLFLIVSAVLLIPVTDALRVFLLRFASGLSIFHPDRSHLHHLVLSLGMSHKRVTNAIIGMEICALICAGILSMILEVTTTIFLLITLQIALSKFLRINHRMVQWQQRIGINEKVTV